MLSLPRQTLPFFIGTSLLVPWMIPLRAAIIRADASIHWTENLARTSAAANERDAYGADVHGSAGWSRQLAPNLSALTHVEAALHATPKYELREHASLGVGANLRYKLGLGPLAPVFAASASAAAKIARLDDDSGFTTMLEVHGTKRLHEAVLVGATIEWKRHRADSATFDVGHRRYTAHASWDVTDRWRISHGHARLEGSFTANAAGAAWNRAIGGQVSPEVTSYYNSIPWQVTEIYGPAWVTYNVSGRAKYWWLEISPALTERSSLTLRYEQVAARNLIGIEYDQSIWSLSLAHQF
jgi:hypothetical protein